MLRKLHIAAATFQLAQFAAITALVSTNAGSDWPLLSRAFDRTVGVYDYPLAYLLPAVPALSAVNHVVAASAPGLYSEILQSGTNPVRWGEYAFSAGVMLWLVGTLSGVIEIRSLVSLVLLNGVLQLVGYNVERSKALGLDDVDMWLATGFGVHVAIWAQILVSFFTSVNASATVPDYVYSIVIIMFVLFTSFGILAALGAKSAVTFEQVETGYVALSFLSKTLLTWIVYFGVLRRSEGYS
jgi:hypothetical protein